MQKIKPIILREGTDTPGDLKKLKNSEKIWRIADIFSGQLGEVFEITNPTLLKLPDFKVKRDAYVRSRTADQDSILKGNWIYFPWNGTLVHTVSEQEYLSLRTNRNRELITRDEQRILYDFRVGIIGLSVGSNVATMLSYCGVANTIKLAEFDTLETSNLNRIRARMDQIGMPKIDVVSEQIYEVNPYANLTCFRDGITKEVLSEFVLQDPKPQLIFEIIDSFEMKIHLRSLARSHGIPVIMVTNLGDRVLMDVERYDLDKNIGYFNGRAGKVPADILERPDITDTDKHRYAVELAGAGNVPQKALDSVRNIGKTLVGRPQLASSVATSGNFGAYLTRKIALKEGLPSASWLVDFDAIFSKGSLFDLAPKR